MQGRGNDYGDDGSDDKDCAYYRLSFTNRRFAASKKAEGAAVEPTDPFAMAAAGLAAALPKTEKGEN